MEVQTDATQKRRTTVYLEEGDIASLDELRAYFRRVEHRGMDRSEIMREAVRKLHERLLGSAIVGGGAHR
ncbi:MAG: ribbon-helix-helix domain-containing protein [Chloroflexota bacterium]|nr:ribbon-helix-helix domain-containing protein [Chloroflexota bacterium]